MAQSYYLILSFDGGGIRGLISALLVQQLDQEFDFLKTVDLFAGTSTGGLLALGLASDVHIDTLADVYKTRGREVFKRYASFSPAPPQAFMDRYPEAAAMSIGLGHVKYTDEGLKRVVQETFPTSEKRLDQLERKVLVAAFDLYQPARNAWAPISLTNLPGSKTSDISVLDAALSTCAAPVYFPPHTFEQNGKEKALVDGGVYANNPSMLATASVMASDTLNERPLTVENMKLLSLGTGFNLNSIPPGYIFDPEGFGVWRWMCPLSFPSTPQYPLLSVLMDGVSEIDTFYCKQILGNNFRRGNVEIPQIDLDDYDSGTLNELTRMTEAYMRSAEWSAIKRWIANEFV